MCAIAYVICAVLDITECNCLAKFELFLELQLNVCIFLKRLWHVMVVLPQQTAIQT